MKSGSILISSTWVISYRDRLSNNERIIFRLVDFLGQEKNFCDFFQIDNVKGNHARATWSICTDQAVTQQFHLYEGALKHGQPLDYMCGS